jgi:TonB-linked SusC/RagA family outer membrane protein
MNLLIKRMSLALLTSLFCVVLYAQKTVTGTVKDASGEPMIGVSISADGTIGAVTDIDGNFTLQKCEPSTVLKVTYVGYKPVTLKVGDSSQINIVLQEDNKTLDELVVVGYGVMKRRDLTGAIGSVKSEDLKNLASANAMQAMQAKIPGLDIQQSSGQAGSGLSINLRGNRSILAGNGPLILVDGVPYGSTLDINPSDIESMEVLKDASSTAIYGSQGANGVIIITTKRGKSGKTKISLNAYNSFNSPTNVHSSMYGTQEVQRMIDANDYKANLATYLSTGTWGTQVTAPEDVLTESLADGTSTLDIYKDGSYTDWGDLILKNTSTQNYEVSAAGGNEKTNFNVSLGAMYDKGLMKNDDMARYNGKVNIDHTINNMFKVGTSLLFTYKDVNVANSGEYSQAMKMTTITHAYLNDGTINATPNPWYAAHCSPILDYEGGGKAYQNNTESTRFFGNAYLQITPIKGMVFKSLFAVDRSDARYGLYEDYESQPRYQSPKTDYLASDKYNTTALTWDNTLNYNFNIEKKHDFTFLLGHELRQSVYESTNITGEAGTTHYYTSAYYDMSKVTSPTIVNTYTKWTMLSFFGRMNYKFDEKYLATFSLRADGASRLAEGHKWGYFPSAALGWRINDENFMKNVKWVDNLKFRVSWGLSGNSSVDPYGTQATLSDNNLYYFFGAGTTASDVAGKIPSTMANPNLKWEKTSSFDFGLDFAFLNNRINGSIDVYFNKTSDLLFYKTAPASSVFTTVTSNIGDSKGHGIEVALNTRAIESKDFTWDINWSYSHMYDEISTLTDGVDHYITGTTIYKVGEPVKAFYDYETDGCWGIGEYEKYIADWQARHPGETAAYPTNYGTPGTLKIIDRNDDGKLSSTEGEDDRRVYSREPKHIFGMNNTFTYKDFSLSVQLYARLGGYISYEMNKQLNYESANWGDDIDYWTPTNTGAKFPSPGAATYSALYSTYSSALMYEKADYFKIKDITLAYNLPKSFINKFGVDNVKIYGSLKNYFNFSRVSNYDSERGGSVSYPLKKQAVIGINVEF